jgi:hypothetical protein
VVYRASWPDELVLRCRLDELGDAIRTAKITTQALVILGPALDGAADAGRSHVYDPGYGHRFRPLGRPDRYRTRAAAAPGAATAPPAPTQTPAPATRAAVPTAATPPPAPTEARRGPA